MQADDNIRHQLSEAAEAIRAADPGDHNIIVKTGTTLEEIRSQMAQPSSPMAALLQSVLEALQAVYLGNAADAAGTMAAAAQAVDVVASHLDAESIPEGAIEEAAEAINRGLGKEAKPEETPTPSDDTSPVGAGDVSLDDVMALWVTLEAENPEQLERVSKMLMELLKSRTLPAEAAKHAEAARNAIVSVAQGQAADPAVAMAEANEAFECACKARNAAELGEPSVQEDEDQPEPEPALAESATEQAASEAPPSDEPAFLPEDTDFEILAEYIVESLDHVAGAEAALLELETNPEESEPVHVVFRAFHTIKGTSGFLGLDRIKNLAHLAENLLDRVRNREIRLTGGYADISLEASDMLKEMIEGLRGVEAGAELKIPANYSDLIDRLKDPEAHGISDQVVEEGPVVPRVGDIVVAQGGASRQAVEKAASGKSEKPIGEKLVSAGAASAGDVAKALRVQKQMKRTPTNDATIRVGTDRLDSLVNMVGELVIAQSMVAEDPGLRAGTNLRLKRNVGYTGKIIRELQDLSMSLRMVPLRGTFQKMARLVRDLARKSGKSVQFVTEGDDTEIDRNMVEALNDPLVHMIRNAVDHGIESLGERTAGGKSSTGTVCLRAYHSAGSVVIELEDDGKGIDREKVVAKAIDRGLIEPEATITDAEAYALIFRPGFSTAEKVTDVSGRGVGMDVVKKGIEGMRGRVDLTSEFGKGSTFTIRLPLTMAIIDAMLLRVGDERFLLPTVAVEQSFRPESGAVHTVAGRGEVVMQRGDLIPIIRLHRLFGISKAEKIPRDAILIAVESDGRRCALMADEVLGRQQVVIKSLGEGIGRVPGISGGAILGDGRVGLILDAAGVLRLSDEGDADRCLTVEDQVEGESETTATLQSSAPRVSQSKIRSTKKPTLVVA